MREQIRCPHCSASVDLMPGFGRPKRHFVKVGQKRQECPGYKLALAVERRAPLVAQRRQAQKDLWLRTRKTMNLLWIWGY